MMKVQNEKKQYMTIFFLILIGLVVGAIAAFAIQQITLPSKPSASCKEGYFYSSIGGGVSIVGIKEDTISEKGELEIPSELGGRPVTGIAEGAFAGNEDLTCVVIPDSVTSIGESAFYGCSDLVSAYIPASVERIGSYAFDECSNLSIYVDEDCDISDWDVNWNSSHWNSSGIPVLFNCEGMDTTKDGLVYVETSEDRIIIASYVGDSKDVDIPAEIDGEPVYRIARYAFRGATLYSVHIPKSIVEIGEGAFVGSYNLRIYTAYSSKPSGWDDDWNVSDGYVAWEGRKHGKTSDGLSWEMDNDENITILDYDGEDEEVEIPDTISGRPVTAIGANVFNQNKNITSVTIPDSVTSIGEGAFYDCRSLDSVNMPTSLISIGDWAFYQCQGLSSVTIPDSVTTIGEAAFLNSNISSLTIGKGVTSIGDAAFRYCVSLDNINILNGVTSISNQMFSECTELVSVTIPDSVTSIGVGAFSGCEKLSRVTIPRGVKSIGVSAFYECGSLTSVTIPDSVTSIGVGAFTRCVNLANVTIPNSVNSIGANAFLGCGSLLTVTLPDSVTSIGADAFYACSHLVIYAEANKKPIGWDRDWNPSRRPVEWGCVNQGVTDDGLAWMQQADNCMIIVGYSGNGGVLSIPHTINGLPVTKIGGNAFYKCSSITSVIIPDSVTSIGDGAFYDCDWLNSLILPDSVIRMGEYVFVACRNLIIYAEASDEPGGWDTNWNADGVQIEWGYKQ